jgi:SAM-dependent methyltransferase
MTTFHETSYARHAEGFAPDLVDPERKLIAASWFDSGTADSWRHARAYEIARHLGVPGERWITVGDGRFGLDAINLKRYGADYVLATDLAEPLLKASRDQGHILEYSIENAEHLSFADRSFDYVFCKESYHHFPRPMLALYEMLRVARKGVVLVEPNDRERSPLRLLKRLMRCGAPLETYEEDGNYVYSISEREITKVALGIDMPQVAFKGMNDAWTPDLWKEPANNASPRYRKMRRKIAFRDLLCRLGADHSMFLMACLFHVPLSTDRRRAMERNGWLVTDLPRNPYITSHTATG